MEESLLADDLDRFRIVVETLAEQYDVMDVAAAAVKLAHELAGAGGDDEEVPDELGRGDCSARGPEGRAERPGGREGRRSGGGMTRLFVGAGRVSGIRPQDLVGAIANETKVSGRDIGAIEIADRFSLVEVPAAAAADVIAALRATTIKGLQPNIRRERFARRP